MRIKFEVKGSKNELTIAARAFYEMAIHRINNETRFYMALDTCIQAYKSYKTPCETRRSLGFDIRNLCNARLNFLPDLQGMKFGGLQKLRSTLRGIRDKYCP